MKKRSILALILASVMAVSTFAGCAGSPDPQSSATEDSKSETSTTDSTADNETDEEKPVLRHLLINGSEDYNTYPVAADIEEITGYKVQYDMLPKDAPADKLNLLMASEEEYDMVTYIGDTALVMNYAQNGALTDINPYLESAPNLNAAITDYARETFTVDGGLYAIGMDNFSIDGYGEVRMTLFARQDWMDALNIEKPTTTDEFAEMLRAFKDYDNGTGNKVIPMTITGTGVLMDGLLGAFGIPNEWNEVDGQLVNRAADPRMKDYLTFLKGLYDEGLLDAEFPANKVENAKEKYTNGISGVSFFGYWDCPSLYETMDKTQPGHVQAFLPYLVGPNGDVGIGTRLASGFDRISFIPKASKNVEDVIKYMDTRAIEENFLLTTLGREGEHYTIAEDGEFWPIAPKFFEERGLANNYDVVRTANYPTYWKCRAKKNENQWNCWEYLNKDETVKSYNIADVTSKAPSFPETAKNNQALMQMLVDEMVKIIAGTEPVDSYDAFIEKWMAAGGAAMTQEYNDWWATQK